MAVFTVNGFTLDLPDAVSNAALRERLQQGQYEQAEANALERHFKPTDRLLELGSGTGFLAAIAGRIASGTAITGVEAIPAMVEVARNNLARNKITGAAMHWGAAVPDSHEGAHVPFQIAKAFWASGIAGGTAPQADAPVPVPALKIGDLLRDTKATVLLCDIEGGELALFDQDLPASLRMVILELHRKIYGDAGIARIFAALARNRFTYHPWGSKGPVVVFKRY